MDRRAFIWTALAALAGAGCVSRSPAGVASWNAAPASNTAGALPVSASTTQAEAIFKEFTGSAWDHEAFAEADETRWMGNAAVEPGGASPLLPRSDVSTPEQMQGGNSRRSSPGSQARAAEAQASKKQRPRAEKKQTPGPAPAPRSGPRSQAGDIRRAANGNFMIKPGEVLQFQAQGYCLDPDRPAPANGEPMRFIPMSGLINFRLRRLFYKVLHAAGGRRGAYAADYQNVIWAIRTADSRQSAWGDALGSAEKRLLNEVMPGGAALLQQVRRTATGRASGGMGLAPIMPGVDFSADSRIHLRRLFNETPRNGMPHATAQFSMLSPGIAGRAENLGGLKVRWQIANSTDKDFFYDSAQWALESPRNVQREALPPPGEGLVVKA